MAGVARDTHDCGVCWRWWLAAVSIFFPIACIAGKEDRGFLSVWGLTRETGSNSLSRAYEPGGGYQKAIKKSMGGWWCRWVLGRKVEKVGRLLFGEKIMVVVGTPVRTPSRRRVFSGQLIGGRRGGFESMVLT